MDIVHLYKHMDILNKLLRAEINSKEYYDKV